MNLGDVPILGPVVDRFSAYGFTRKIIPTDNPGLRRIEAPGLVGVEDITIDQERGIAYLSAADRRTQLAGGPERGGLYRLDLTDPGAEPQPISGEGLYPHGIAVWVAPDGHRELYVIDHAGGRHRILRYRVNGAELELLRVYSDRLIYAPNDLTVTGDGECYVTNDHGFRRTRLQKVEEGAALAISNVVHISDSAGQDNPVTYTKALSGVPYANGIAWHSGRREMFVAAMMRRQIWRCTVEPGGRLRRTAVFPTAMCVDNIEIDADGALWIGGHPRIYQMIRHGLNPRAHSASQVIRMDPATGEFSTAFEDDGANLSGCSVGARWNDRLLIGSVFEPFIVELPLRSENR